MRENISSNLAALAVVPYSDDVAISAAGFNPTLTIQALAYMSADAIANRYRKNPGPLL
jgi:hypothetical protein